MDATALARSLLEPVPAHRTAGLTVLRAIDGAAEVAVEAPGVLGNVIGSLHSSGLATLVDAAALAAILSAGDAPGELDGVLPLGASASFEYLAPARGRLIASCKLSSSAAQVLRPVLAGTADRARISTQGVVTDERHAVVCRGGFEWSVRRVTRTARIRPGG
ncbi:MULTISPECIES: hypothetical protein [Streptomyces]|jgi:acyl-coenzyme A thioesterase PaaI-like protein|uniref:hypothetical protein n=1 Tax=Streptomyces TaxID=1883 RepID=UPI00036FA164|nr:MULTISPECIES: hypothetical protein [Streptomyces]